MTVKTSYYVDLNLTDFVFHSSKYSILYTLYKHKYVLKLLNQECLNLNFYGVQSSRCKESGRGQWTVYYICTPQKKLKHVIPFVGHFHWVFIGRLKLTVYKLYNVLNFCRINL